MVKEGIKPGKYFLSKYSPDSDLYFTGIYEITEIGEDGFTLSTGGFVKYDNVILMKRIK